MRRARTLLGRGVGALVVAVGAVVAVGIAASPAAAEPLDPAEVCVAAVEAPFADRGTTHAPAIDCLTTYTDRDGAPVLRGFADGTFGTSRPLIRGQYAALLYRFLTVADPGFETAPSATPFGDVVGTTHEEAIAALASLGILRGTGADTFDPHAPVTRGAAASALARALEVAGSGLADRPRRAFTDAGETHARAIGALADMRVVEGVSRSRFAPSDPVTRGQVASLLARAAQLLHDEVAWAPEPALARPPTTVFVPPPPRPTPAATHPPRVLAAVGDSITLGSGATREGEGWLDVLPGTSQPHRSWTTGSALGLDSLLQRLRVLDAGVRGVNLAENGARMMHGVTQALRTPATTDLITVQLGGNDLCRPDIASMTDPDVYAAQFQAMLAALAEHRPSALVQVSSIPDVYRLWELRRDDPRAIAFWNGTSILPPLVPCQSLLANATSDAPADEQRRLQVRERTQQLNTRLARVCAAFVRCRFDQGAVWSLTTDPARFDAADISTVDHFHPSFRGQQKLADTAWDAGFDHARTSPPLLDVEVAGDLVFVAAQPIGAVAGIEYRWLSVRALRPPWTASIAPALALPLDEVSRTLEVRAIGVDGNVGASHVVVTR